MNLDPKQIDRLISLSLSENLDDKVFASELLRSAKWPAPLSFLFMWINRYYRDNGTIGYVVEHSDKEKGIDSSVLNCWNYKNIWMVVSISNRYYYHGNIYGKMKIFMFKTFPEKYHKYIESMIDEIKKRIIKDDYPK